ncbi:hypothetical protein [Elizabethkingia anophelis]|uniref:hypothetical protein n=1 Tax=Elizabethkingia anophelis TaxID=1117645 RepID=UPI0038924568
MTKLLSFILTIAIAFYYCQSVENSGVGKQNGKGNIGDFFDMFKNTTDSAKRVKNESQYNEMFVKPELEAGRGLRAYKANVIDARPDKKPINKQEQDLIAHLQEEEELKRVMAEQEIKSTITFNIEVLKKGKLSLEEEHRNLYTINTILSFLVVILLCIWRYKLNKKRK